MEGFGKNMIKYKKIPNNENVIEIDGKIVLSFDPRYKEYLKWRNENPDLEQLLMDNLERDIVNTELYNDGAPHMKGDMWEWYNEGGNKVLECEMDGDTKDGVEISYYDNGQKSSELNYKDGKKTGEYNQWYENGQKSEEGIYKDGKKNGLWIFYNKDGVKIWE